MRYSDLFNVTPAQLAEYGVFNANVNEDSNLHIDPSLLKDCSIPEFSSSYEKFLDYFSVIFILAKNANVSKRAFKDIVFRLRFKEIANTGLGYSKNNKSGNAIGTKLAEQIANSVIELYEMGIEDPVVFELLPFFEDGIGADRISDMTTYILVENFLLYTQRVCRGLGIQMAPSVRHNSKIYDLPQYQGKGLIFVPNSILCDLPTAKDWDDIDDVCSYNTALRRRICQEIGMSWAEAWKLPKYKIKEFLLNHKDDFVGLIRDWKGKSHLSYDQKQMFRMGKSTTKNKPVVFISYSWDDFEHKNWVKMLADTLSKYDIEVKLDQYLRKGSSLTRFMMEGIKNADKVLIIGTPLYKEKAEKYVGGTNVEHQIININICRSFETTKFIPILRRGTFETSFTDLIGDRTGYDFTDDCQFVSLLDELATEIKQDYQQKLVESGLL